MALDVCRRNTAGPRSGIAALASALLIVGCAKAPPDAPPSDPDPDPAAQVEAPTPVPASPPPGMPDAAAVAAFERGAAAVKHSPYRPLDVVPDLEPEAHATGLRDLEAACDGWHPVACRLLGEHQEYRVQPSGEALADAAAQAAASYQRACDAGDAYGCLWLGKLARFGDGVPQDRDRARELEALGHARLRVACDEAGEALACEYVPAYGERDPEALRIYLERALVLFRAGCEAPEGGDWLACEGARRVLSARHGDTLPDDAKALRASLREKACALGSTFNHCHPDPSDPPGAWD